MKYFIPDPVDERDQHELRRGRRRRREGNIYGAEVGPTVYGDAAHLKRYVKP